MGNSVTRAAGCFVPSYEHDDGMAAAVFSDEGIGHSFCYIRPTLESSSAASQSSGDHSHTNSSCLNPESESGASLAELEDETIVGAAKLKHLAQPPLPQQQQQQQPISETSFKCISGASVSANTSTSRSIACLEQFNAFSNGPSDRAAAFESTASFAALPLQPIPRGIAHSGPLTAASCSGPLDRGFMSGPLERGFMSGPLERGFLSGPLERGSMSGPLDRGYLSGPLDQAGMLYSSGSQRRRKKSLADYVKDASMPMRRAIHRTVSNIARGRKHTRHRRGSDDHPVQQELMRAPSEMDTTARCNLQWAQGKAGEDRVHIVLSEEHGWMFVGIYDGFNGPDAPDFLMSNLYQAIYKELQGLLWDQKEAFGFPCTYDAGAGRRPQETAGAGCSPMDYQCSGTESDRKQHEDRMVCGASGEERDRAQGKSKSLLGGKLKQAYRRKKRDNNYKKLFQWRYEHERRIGEDMEQEVDSMPVHSSGRRAVDHSAVLRALERALEATEQAYLEMTERAVSDNPELALVGSCLLVMLMKDEDVYIMNVGDSRAVLAQDTRHPDLPRSCKGQASTNESKDADEERIGARDSMLRMELERIIEETPTELAALESSYDVGELRPPPSSPFLVALQLSSDHSTNVEEEVMKIRVSHPDDEGSVANDRVKGRLKVTRAFGAGFLKQPKLNDALLEMFRIDFVGDAPYITCAPSLQHHRLGPRDQFLVLSSDGLYQYLSNEEVVAHVEWFLEKFPDGDPAQYLIEELLFRAAKKAGMDFHELLEIPQGDRRRYHDDVSLIVISLEGRIWRSSS